MIIRVSKKLAGRIKEGGLSASSREVGLFDDWYGRTFSHSKTQYILTTNAYTLYSVVIYAKGIKDSFTYIDAFRHHIKIALQVDGFFEISKIVDQKFLEVNFAKPDNRSVIGSMNEMVFHAKVYLEHGDDRSPSDITRRINRTPFSYLKYHFPDREMENVEAVLNKK